VRPSQLPAEADDEVFGSQAAAWQELLDGRRAMISASAGSGG
jgi:hypothetical protein